MSSVDPQLAPCGAYDREVERRRTFAIISHPDAGKTTLTEKLLLLGGAIQMAGTIKARKAQRHATSDWMSMEKERGISVTSSVMQFHYRDCVMNLLDTPGHEDFSEDTYRTLTAVDSALMVIDAAKGVEERTVKLMEVCRLRTTPILTFVNKLDRYGREPVELIDEVERVLDIQCSPITWPIGMGPEFRGVYHLQDDRIFIYDAADKARNPRPRTIQGLQSEAAGQVLGHLADQLREEVELVRGASHPFDRASYLAGRQTPVFFGSALNHFGVSELLDAFAEMAPPPQGRESNARQVAPNEDKLTGFVFKIQANMDPGHRDRIAFMRICSGKYSKGMKMRHVRLQRDIKVADAVTFLAAERQHAEEAYAGDILGLHNHGTINIGDTFSQGEQLMFRGIPDFAPELFRRAVLRDPLRMKALQKGLEQLCEEGATQLFRPLASNDLILGAVGQLQFDVVTHRLAEEYGVTCQFENINVATARWVSASDPAMLEEFRRKAHGRLALDHHQALVYLAPSAVNLQLTQERWPAIAFLATREHQAG